MSDTGEKKICGCNQETFVKILNMGVAIMMMVVGFTNLFRIFKALSNVGDLIFYVSFTFY